LQGSKSVAQLSCRASEVLRRPGVQGERDPDLGFSGCPGFPLKFTLAKAGAGMTVLMTFARASWDLELKLTQKRQL